MSSSCTSCDQSVFRPGHIFVTGGCGFIGSAVIRALLERFDRCTVVNLDKLTYAADPDALAELEPQYARRYRFVRGDITDADTVAGILSSRQQGEIDCIVNIAAESHVDRSIENSAPFILTNVLGTQVLLDAARRFGIRRFIQISTDEVYGSLPVGSTQRFSEQSPIRPNSPYAATKAAGDMLALAAHHTFGLNTIITRCSNNFGPGQFPEKVIPLFITRLLTGQRVPLYGDGLHVRDWIHVTDHAQAVAEVVERGRPGRVYNIGADNERSNLELTRLLIELTERDESAIRYVEERPGHDRRYAIDALRIREETGWKPERTDWRAALAQTVGWYREHEPWWRSRLSGEV